MELKYKSSQILETESFYVERKNIPYFGSNWHYHESHELLFTIKGQGVRIVGDNIDHFTGSELVLMGGGLPHLFKNEEKEEDSDADFIIVKFKNLLKEASFFSLPEFADILYLIENSKRGIIFSKSTVFKIHKPLIHRRQSAND